MPMKPVRPEKSAPMAKPTAVLAPRVAKSHEHDRADHGNDGVLALHVSSGTFLDGGGDLLHPLVTLGEPQNPLRRNQPVDNRGSGAGQGENNCILFHY
jgi:hypothetical protein